MLIEFNIILNSDRASMKETTPAAIQGIRFKGGFISKLSACTEGFRWHEDPP
ncbi:MAG: hypothetical protein QNJ72_11365 [Pleurocapsa sp. MO_226.B13]|nr:hypothetical protein [Pleurocapsa sp. MO_226.B13]